MKAWRGLMRMRAVPVSATHVVPHETPSRFCKDCKHFVQPLVSDAKRGRCARWGRANQVDGSLEFWLASEVRGRWCKGDWFEQRETVLPRFEKLPPLPIALAIYYAAAVIVWGVWMLWMLWVLS